jgi:hypothetical protein
MALIDPIKKLRGILVRPPNRYSRFIYRFQSVTNPDYLKSIIVDSKLWLSSPNDFNDPFDAQSQYIFEGSPKEKRDRIRKLVKRNTNLRGRELERQVTEFMVKPDLLGRLRAAHAQSIGQLGVCCFSKTIHSPPLWAHYADSYKGIALQFYVAQHAKLFCMALPVVYDVNYPILNYVNDYNLDFISGILRKHPAWRYEAECRICVPDGAHKYLDFEPRALVGIVYGSRVSDPAIAMMRKLLAERKARGFPEIREYRAQQSQTAYRLIIKRL